MFSLWRGAILADDGLISFAWEANQRIFTASATQALVLFFYDSCPQFWFLSYPITEQLNMTTQENNFALVCVVQMLRFKLLEGYIVL